MIIAIDGACRRNGSPTCLSAGAAFIKCEHGCTMQVDVEKHSTSQRGELRALIRGLQAGLLHVLDETVYLITDSEYVFNTLSKGWIGNWVRKGWVTSAGEQVKNKDLWQGVQDVLVSYNNIELIPYHIKGHLLPFGKVAARNILDDDLYGSKMYATVKSKLMTTGISNGDKQNALELFKRNHGHELPIDVFNEMVICNTVADQVAGYTVDMADIEWSKNSYM